jgi:hypothetical protein
MSSCDIYISNYCKILAGLVETHVKLSCERSRNTFDPRAATSNLNEGTLPQIVESDRMRCLQRFHSDRLSHRRAAVVSWGGLMPLVQEADAETARPGRQPKVMP